MEYNILDDLRDLNILIKRKLFSLGKKNGINVPPSPLQVKIFMYIYESEGEVSQVDLVRELNVSKVSISEAVSKMVNSGNLEVITSKKDARKNVITVTEKGTLIMNTMIHSFETLNKDISENLTLEELELFSKVMQKLKKNIREE